MEPTILGEISQNRQYWEVLSQLIWKIIVSLRWFQECCIDSQGDSKSDYHGSVQKFGHLFQSPDFRGPQVRQNFLGGGEEGYFNTAIWEGYHHQPSKGGFRASSFDKANGTGGHGTQHH